MDDRRNYYRVLHLQPDAPIELVRSNYRVLMQKLAAHPDLGGENWRAAHLNAGYRILSNPETRAAYDRELLSRSSIEVIAEGRRKPRARRRAAPPRTTGNQRNYYRVLQTQRDAPIEIIESSHRALVAADPENRPLLDQALAFLSDQSLRSLYDRVLEVCDHQEALARIYASRDAPPPYEPIIKSYCAFCKRPHKLTQDVHPDASCGDCKSPLFPPPRKLLELARRALSRVSRTDPLALFFDWPSKSIPGKLIDLSPTGLKCETPARLDLNDVVKIEADDFDAVGSVAHATYEEDRTSAGMRFLAIRFPQSIGNFRSLKA